MVEISFYSGILDIERRKSRCASMIGFIWAGTMNGGFAVSVE
jgi:hypothetical protein